jgi:hypothetical protein
MSDPNLDDFQQRVARIERAHVSGLGFEAEGTLGRSHYTRKKGFRLPLMGPVLVVMGLGTMLKSLIHVRLGGDLYQARVDGLWSDEGLGVVGALIMQPDPLTIWLAERLSHLV